MRNRTFAVSASLVLTSLALAWSIPDTIAHPCDRDPDPAHRHCRDSGPGDDTVDLSNLVRVQMADWSGAGISQDNEATCDPGGVTYDYWDGTDSGVNGLITPGPPGCQFHNIDSNASGGGRWFLRLPTLQPPPLLTTRWLTVDFASSPGDDACPDFEDEANDNAGSVYTHNEMPETAPGVCVDNLTVWIQAQRALHPSASRAPLKIRLMRIGESAQGSWVEFAFIEYIDPLYLRTPVEGDVGHLTACNRVISTEPGAGGAGHVRAAELREWESVFNGPLIGTYDLRFEACLTKAE
jgi:hypothetical protein